MEDKISNYGTGFQKSHGNQLYIAINSERLKQAIDKADYIWISPKLFIL